MAITIDIPAEVEESLREEVSDFDMAIKETALVGLYRQRKLSHHQLGVSLGLSWHEVEALLKRHEVREDLMTREEFQQQLESLRNFTNH